MAVVIDEMTVQVEPGTSDAQSAAAPAGASQGASQGASALSVRAQLAQIARRTARQRVD